MPTPPVNLPALRLKRGEERRLKAGHLWVFSNEVDNRATPLRAFEAGEPVRIETSSGRFLAYGYVNPNSLICARIMSRDERHPATASLLVHRLNVALSLRRRAYEENCYRLVYADSDLLPGLIVDRYDDFLVAQLTTAGMEAMKPQIVGALKKVIKPAGVLLKNDTAIRTREGLNLYVEVVHGDVPAEAHVVENGVSFRVPLAGGQKTGWYFDQRDNRDRLKRYVTGARVLDVFSYVGAWGLMAARHGGLDVCCVDSSAPALEILHANASVNHLDIEAAHGDAFVVMTGYKDQGRRFDLIILDPPAFIKRRKDLERGKAAYRRLNQLAMQLLENDAILISCSCSHHLAEADLAAEIQKAARHVGCHVQILERGGQAADHPVHPAIPETRYLKALFCRVVRT